MDIIINLHIYRERKREGEKEREREREMYIHIYTYIYMYMYYTFVSPPSSEHGFVKNQQVTRTQDTPTEKTLLLLQFSVYSYDTFIL